MLRAFALAALLWALAVPASAATCFWVGGAGSWTNANTASWASSSGGTTGTCAAVGGIPINAADVATFDGSSGGGTVTVNGNFSLTQIVCDAFTGTLDYATNNNNVTLSGTSNALSCSGSSTKTLNMGSGVWTFTGASGTLINMATTTAFTLNSTTCTIAVTSSAAGHKTITLNTNKQLCNLVVTANPNGGDLQLTGGGPGIYTSITVNAPNRLIGSSGSSITATSYSLAGSPSNPIFVTCDGAQQSCGNTTFNQASGTVTATGLGLAAVTFGGGATWIANSSFNLGKNSGITINPPSGSGGGIIGG